MTNYTPQIGDTVRWRDTTTTGTELTHVAKIARISIDGSACCADGHRLYNPNHPEQTTLIASAKPKWGDVYGNKEVQVPAYIYLPQSADDLYPWLGVGGGTWESDGHVREMIQKLNYQLMTGEHLGNS